MISIADFAKREGVSYEAIRRQVYRHKDKLGEHLVSIGRTNFLDEEGEKILRNLRASNQVVIINESRADELEQLRKANIYLQAKIDILTHDLENARNQSVDPLLLENKDKQIEDLTGERDDLKEENVTLKGERDSLKEERDSLKTENDSLKGERDDLKDQLLTEIDEKNRVASSLDKEKADRLSAEAKVEDLEAKARESAQTAKEAQDQLEQNERILQAAQSRNAVEVEEKKKAISERDELQAQVDEFENMGFFKRVFWKKRG